MNINDFQPRGLKDQELWSESFRLSSAFLTREPKLCLTHEVFFSLDCPYCQATIKDWTYRVFEEICEALEPGQEFHRHEEYADAGIFFNCLVHRLGRPDAFLGNPSKNNSMNGEDYVLEAIRQLGLMTNTLKLRPWRNQFSLTDRGEFYDRMNKAVETFKYMVQQHFDGNWGSFLEIVDLKLQVNAFRLRSNY